MKSRIVATALSATLGATGMSAVAAQMLYEEAQARAEERLILRTPIGGVANHFWFDYRNNVGEAQKELSTDLRKSTDNEDLRDAWEEYTHELRHERAHYVKEMNERGYRYGTVRVED